jgi:hypothetical protein
LYYRRLLEIAQNRAPSWSGLLRSIVTERRHRVYVNVVFI